MQKNFSRGLIWTVLAIGSAVVAPAVAYAQQPGSDIGSTFGQVQNAANGWIPAIMSAATRLFFLLASIDFAWSVPNLLREHDFMGLFLGIIKRLLVIGIFYWVLVQGQTWVPAIVQSFVQIGANATGLPSQMNPTDIMGRGVQICSDLLTKTQNANLLTQFGAVVATWFLVAIVFISYGIITLHYVVTKLESIIVMSAGYLFLGFGGSRWTMPYFERYIALAISTGTRLMLIYLMLGVFQTVSTQWEATMSAWDPTQPIGPMFSEVAAMLLFAFAAWMIPKMAGSIASGSLGLGASDLLSVGGAAAAGTAAAVGTVAALAAAPFTGGGSLAADAAMMGLEGSTLAEAGGMAAEGAAVGSSVGGTEAASAMSGSAGIPANVPPPPADASMDIGASSTPPPPSDPPPSSSGPSSSSSSAPQSGSPSVSNGSSSGASAGEPSSIGGNNGDGGQSSAPGGSNSLPEIDSEQFGMSAFERLKAGKPLESGPVGDALASAYERGEINTPEDVRGVMQRFYSSEDGNIQNQPPTAPATIVSDAQTSQAQATDSTSARLSSASAEGTPLGESSADTPPPGAEQQGERKRRAFPAVPDDGAAHTPPPQLRVDREE